MQVQILYDRSFTPLKSSKKGSDTFSNMRRCRLPGDTNCLMATSCIIGQAFNYLCVSKYTLTKASLTVRMLLALHFTGVKVHHLR